MCVVIRATFEFGSCLIFAMVDFKFGIHFDYGECQPTYDKSSLKEAWLGSNNFLIVYTKVITCKR